MLPKQVPKPRRASSGGTPKSSEPEKSPSSSTISSSKHNFESSYDVQSLSSNPSAKNRPAHFIEGNHTLDKPKESVIVTVRFRPLSPREIRHGEELAWYADGDTIVRNESNPSIAYAYDRVFGPTTTTRHVYDVAAQNVISGAMEGINGTIFAYGVTSSGKTHTMHGDQRSPGIIPLAVKDAFSIIQEIPNREFLLRVSYLEIYNEVVNDLLNPAGQNLRIREDSQGTFIEGIKEEVVLSPAHALSLIAAGEEHRHVGSTNFNALSSRSHTIFTLTIESSPCGQQNEGDAVTFSQLNLIDLAGSESSKVETTGLRRKEGSYINKSLLTLGTVISKLTEGSSTHIPYRDSKLTRILQPSLSGRGRVSLICTITPASSSSEETHNTIKFAHRAKRIEILASQNKILDEKSLIKKYQNEIRSLKDELEQLKKGMVNAHQLKDTEEGNFVRLKQKLEDGQFKLQSRLEQEEEAKAVLLNRIQKLTKLILVSTKATQPSRSSSRTGPRRRHSFGEEELAYLPYKRRDLTVDEESVELYSSLEGSVENFDSLKEEKKSRKLGLLSWLKMRKRESNDKSISQISNSASSIPQAEIGEGNADSVFSLPSQSQMPLTVKLEEDFETMSLGHESPSSLKSSDQIELLREQQKILSGDVALQSSTLKRLADAHNQESTAEMMKINEDIKNKNDQISLLEIQINSIIISQSNMSKSELSHRVAELTSQLNEKTFVLEVKAADNSIIQDQLSQKISECESLKLQLSESTVYQTQESNETKGLKEKVKSLENSKEQLEIMNQKLSEESSYAKGLASAAAVELKALSEEVAKLIDHNERLTNEVNSLKSSPTQRRTPVAGRPGKRAEMSSDVKREVAALREKEMHYEAALAVKDQNETELLKRVEESKRREAYLENELANMWVLVAKLKKGNADDDDDVDSSYRVDHFPG